MNESTREDVAKLVAGIVAVGVGIGVVVLVLAGIALGFGVFVRLFRWAAGF